MASAARGRLLQLLCARVRHAQARAPPPPPLWAARRSPYTAGVGAGVSPSAAATAAEVSASASSASASAAGNQQQQQQQQQPEPSENEFETNGTAASPSSNSYPFTPPPPPPGGVPPPLPSSAPPPFRPPPPTPPAAPPAEGGGGGAEADAAAAAWLYRRFRQRGGADLAFDVIQFFPDGTALEHHRPLTPAELELHPRDVGLFAPSPRLAAPQRATIAVHDDKVLFRTEVARAIITADRAVLFKSARRRAETARMARAILSALQQQPPQAPGGEPLSAAAAASASASAAALPQLPFELRVLEVLLDATADYFYRKTQHLNWMLEAVGGDEGASASAWASVAAGGGGGGGAGAGLGGDSGQSRSDASVASSALRSGPMAALARAEPFAAMDKAHQLVPVQRFLTAVKADVQETAKAIEAVRDHRRRASARARALGAFSLLVLSRRNPLPQNNKKKHNTTTTADRGPRVPRGAVPDAPAAARAPAARRARSDGGSGGRLCRSPSPPPSAVVRRQARQQHARELPARDPVDRGVPPRDGGEPGEHEVRQRAATPARFPLPRAPTDRRPRLTPPQKPPKNKTPQARLADRPRRQPQPHHPGQHVDVPRVH
jgi:hypothetical protein